jgi:hypothetical protein
MSQVYVNLSQVACLPPDAGEGLRSAAETYDAHMAAAASTLEDFKATLQHQLVSGSPEEVERVVQALAASAVAWGSTSLASWLLEWFRDYAYVEATLRAERQRDYAERMAEDA